MDVTQRNMRDLAQQFGSLDAGWSSCDLYTGRRQVVQGSERQRLLMRIYYLICTSPDHAVCCRRLEAVQQQLLCEWGPLRAPRRIIPHPWSELDSMDQIPLLGFGSLINWMSTAADLSCSGVPALTFGLRRVFNYEQDLTPDSFSGSETGPDAEHAKLNAIHTGNIEDVINGLLYTLTPQELHRLRFRERGYDLIEIPIVRYDQAFGAAAELPDVTHGYMLMVPPHLHAPGHLKPHISYLHCCIEGAYHYGPAFVDLFMRSTYIADLKTPLQSWLHDTVRSMLVK